MGDLSGNRFTLIIRDIQGPPDGELAKMVERFVKHGFINYFGLQRFGTGAVSSYRIGTALLKGNWKGAIDLILSPRAGEGDERAIEARKRWAESGNAHAAYPLFPHRYTAERQILAHFMRDTRNQNDHLGAILSVPASLLLEPSNFGDQPRAALDVCAQCTESHLEPSGVTAVPRAGRPAGGR